MARRSSRSLTVRMPSVRRTRARVRSAGCMVWSASAMVLGKGNRDGLAFFHGELHVVAGFRLTPQTRVADAGPRTAVAVPPRRPRRRREWRTMSSPHVFHQLEPRCPGRR